MTELNCPRLREVGCNFLDVNNAIQSLSLPSLEYAGSRFVGAAPELRRLDCPALTEMGDYGAMGSPLLTEINVPKLRRMGSYHLDDLSSKQRPQYSAVHSYSDPAVLIFDLAKCFSAVSPRVKRKLWKHLKNGIGEGRGQPGSVLFEFLQTAHEKTQSATNSVFSIFRKMFRRTQNSQPPERKQGADPKKSGGRD